MKGEMNWRSERGKEWRRERGKRAQRERKEGGWKSKKRGEKTKNIHLLHVYEGMLKSLVKGQDYYFNFYS